LELYYRKQFDMYRLLSYFKKAFNIATITLKNSSSNDDVKRTPKLGRSNSIGKVNIKTHLNNYLEFKRKQP